MSKLFVTLWLVAGVGLVSAYFSPPVQRSLRQSKAEEWLAEAKRARKQAEALSHCDDREKAKTEAAAQWARTAGAAEAALEAFPDPLSPGAIHARVLLAEARAQTGQIDVAFQILSALEKQTASDPVRAEAVQAMLAKTNHQIATMIRLESSDDGSWIKYSESACTYYKELLKNAPDEKTRDAYRKNLSCVTHFLYGGDEPICWAMPIIPTVDCKKKLRRLERDKPGGGGGNKDFKPPSSDAADFLRLEAIKKTQQGNDEGK